MAFLVEKGTFAKRTTVGTDIISHSMADTPDILIFWNPAQTATGLGGHYIYCMGFSDATRHKAIAGVSEDEQSMSDTSRLLSTTKCILIPTLTGTTEAEADISAVSSTNFTVNWTTNGGGADIIHYMIFSGSDIVTSEVGDFVANIVTGNQTISHTNSPTDGYDIYMFLTSGTQTAGSDKGLGLGMGFATSATNEAALFVASEDNRGTSDTHRFQREDRCIVQLVPSTGAIDAEAEFVSKQTADFTINWIDAPASGDIILFMGIKGGKHHVNNFTEPGSIGTQDITDAGFTTKGYMLATFGRSAQTTVQIHNIISFGASDGTSEGDLSARDRDGNATTDTEVSLSNADVLQIIAVNAGIEDEANHSALLSNGFRINWTNVGELAEIFYWTFGSEAVARRRFPQKPINLRY